MAKDISISTRSIGSGDSKKTYYSFDIIDPDTGRPIKSYNTTDEQKARKFYEQAKKDYPDATTNGESGPTNLNDDLPSQGEYELGGFETTDCEQKCMYFHLSLANNLRTDAKYCSSALHRQDFTR